MGSRPPSPKSDSEYETSKFDSAAQTLLTATGADGAAHNAAADDIKWEWGEFPQPMTSATTTTTTTATSAPQLQVTNKGECDGGDGRGDGRGVVLLKGSYKIVLSCRPVFS